jgi:hypothetical protein
MRNLFLTKGKINIEGKTRDFQGNEDSHAVVFCVYDTLPPVPSL